MVRALPQEPEAYTRAARSLRRWDKAPLFSPVRLCPLLGFVDEERTRVGCLAHPAVTGGVDLRDCGAYDAKTCATFECPSFLWLDGPKARLVRAACPDWYLYGLVITDVELVRSSLKLVSDRLGASVDPDEIVARPAALAAARELFALKETAPDRRSEIFGRFSVDETGEPVPRILDYERLGGRDAPEDETVLCLGCDPADAAALEREQTLVRDAIGALANALEG